MINKFFNLKVVEDNGVVHKATWRERFLWLRRGCPLRDEKVVNRYCKMVKNHKQGNSLNFGFLIALWKNS